MNRHSRRRRFLSPVRPLRLEPLEDRSLLAAVITVNTTGDESARDSFVSLREAIQINNRTLAVGSLTTAEQGQVVGTPTSDDTDTIGFNIPGSGVQTISPLSALPVITDPVVIDGYTQPGASPNTNAIDDQDAGKRAFNGSVTVRLSGGGKVLDGLTLNASNSTIRGLILNSFLGNGIKVSGSDNVVEGNLVGTDGTLSFGNGNKASGIVVSGSSNRIGGANAAARNVVSNNSLFGVELVGPNATGNLVQGNFVGTDVAGTRHFGNYLAGIALRGASNNTIGGTTAGTRNIVSANGLISGGNGIELLSASNFNVVQGNYVGIDAMGILPLGNRTFGIAVNGSNGNQIGGSAGGAGNVISGNRIAGISLSNSSQNAIQGNYIGTDASGTLPISNVLEGVDFADGNVGNIVGGTTAGAANIIAYNGRNGVYVHSGTSDSNSNWILGNSIFANAGLGIDLDPPGSTQNDSGDDDGGPNQLQNFPEVQSAVLTGPLLTVSYSVASSITAAAYPLRIEFFKADVGGHQGQAFVGSATYVSSGAGEIQTASFTPAAGVGFDDVLLATATDANGNTSEFSASVLVQSAICSTIVINTNDHGANSLRAAIDCANQSPGRDTISFNIPGTSPFTIAPTSSLPQITDAVIIDGYTQPGATSNTNAIDDPDPTQRGFNGQPALVLDGKNAGSSTNGLDFAGASNSVVRGLAMIRWSGTAIDFSSTTPTTGVRIEGNFFGREIFGGTTAPNGMGVRVFAAATGITIGGTTPAARNVFAQGGGITLMSSGNTVQGNFLGTDIDGKARFIDAAGIDILQDPTNPQSGANNLIGGGMPGARNVVAGGLTIYGSAATGNRVQGNYIGLAVTGTDVISSFRSSGGIELTSTTGNLIGGASPAERNVISGTGTAVKIHGATGAIVEGNFIGTDATGAAIPHTSGQFANERGIDLYGSSNITIGGTTGITPNGPCSGACNVIAGNDEGVWIASSSGNFVQGNFIGTDIKGTMALGNGYGIGIVAHSTGNLIGGTTPAAGNLVSGNSIAAISVGTPGSPQGDSGNVIQGNRIGTTISGDAPLANRRGVQIFEAPSNVVGGTDPGTGNIIAATSDGPGILIQGSTGTVIQGNSIGTDRTGTIDLGNGNSNYAGGIVITNTNHTIGGTAAGAGNTIAFNHGAGVVVTSTSGSANPILGNSIYSNRGLGIDLGADGITPNDGNDADRGANDLQNFPIITDIRHAGTTTTISGKLTSAPNKLYRVELFDNPEDDPSGYGQGRFPLGAIPGGVLTDAAGNAPFAITVPTPSSGGNSISATATSPTNATSEFGCSLVVTTTAESGLGSLRSAITCANQNPGADTIRFNIPGPGVHTITPASPLPTITDAVIIDGYTQPGSSANTQAIDDPDPARRGLNGQPLVEISGTGAGTGSGLTLAANNSVVRGLVINGFALDGIMIDGGDNNVVSGNYVGVDSTGAIARPNGHNGIFVFNGASGNIIGTNGDGSSDAAERNLISGNLLGGVAISGAGSDNNRVAGNLIGTTIAGTAALGNAHRAVDVVAGGKRNIVGTNSDGINDAGERNVLSASGWDGVVFSGVGTAQNVAAGNLIGIDATGTQDLGNTLSGVGLFDGATSNIIGGSTAVARNIISGNDQFGVSIAGAGAAGNVVAGNYVGTNAAGTAAVANTFEGVRIELGAANNIVGVEGANTAAAASNLISGNGGVGVLIRGVDTNQNVVAGNFIGTNVTGTTAIGNKLVGLRIEAGAQFNRVGASGDGVHDAAERNVISGNLSDGVAIVGTGTSDNVVAGNFIGTRATGAAALSNGERGVNIFAGAQRNRVGTNADGVADDAERNVISGNVLDGVGMSGVGTSSNVVAGNFIGADVSGQLAIANGTHGVWVFGGAASNLVGGTVAAARNIISGNTQDGVLISGPAAANNVISANYVGTDVSGRTALPNSTNGIRLEGGTTNNRIGTDGDGTADGAEANVISGNKGYGILIRQAGTDNNVVAGNFIGTNAAGTAAVANAAAGVRIEAGARSNRIGTSGDGANDAVERNVISGNLSAGVILADAGTASNVVAGNFIGTSSTGLAAIPNVARGINVLAGAQSNRIGTDANGVADDAERNVISGNGGQGVQITGAGTSANVVAGNYIGVNLSGTGALPNVEHGVWLWGGAAQNTIGGTAAAAANTIAFNAGNGVIVTDATTNANAILGNSILSNENLGIDLGGNGVTQNDADDFDAGPNRLQNYPVISAVARDGANLAIEYSVSSTAVNSYYPLWVEFFSADADGQEGRALLGVNTYTAADFAAGAKAIVLTPAQAVATNSLIVATATDNGGNTSEFSAAAAASCRTVVTNTNDSGIGSLRYAIGCANNAPGLDTIRFEIPGAEVHSIRPTSALPSVTDPLVIDGYTQAGASANTLTDGDNATLLIELDGSAAGAGVSGLQIAAPDTTVRGLAINRFSGFAVEFLPGAAAHRGLIEGNFLGTDATGTAARPNGAGIGAQSSAGGLRIGGTTPAARNLIAGNLGAGIDLFGTSAAIVAGNYLGADATGLVGLANDTNIIVRGVADAVMIGGTTPSARNIIAAARTSHIVLSGADVTRTNIVSNFIGTDRSGTLPLGSGGAGIVVQGGTANVIGGFLPGEGNVIAASGGPGIFVQGGGSNVVYGNYVGTDVTGTLALGNGGAAGLAGLGGVVMEIDASRPNNQVGGLALGTGNTVAFNFGPGVVVRGASGPVNGVPVLGNRLYANTQLGIDLGGDGVTPNDPADPDDGPNHLQNFPELVEVVDNGSVTRVTGVLNSLPTETFRIEFFTSSADDPSGYGEGATFVGATQAFSDAAGNAAIIFDFPSRAEKFVTATATRLFNGEPVETSEFSASLTPFTADLTVTKIAAPDPVQAGANLTYTITVANLGSGAAANVRLADAIPEHTTFVSAAQTSGPPFALRLPSAPANVFLATASSLAGGATSTFTLVVRIDTATTSGATISNTATVTTTSTDSNLDNNTNTELAAVARAGLSLESPPLHYGTNFVTIRGATPGGLVGLVIGSHAGSLVLAGSSAALGIADARLVAQGIVQPDGTAQLLVTINPGAPLESVLLQGFEQAPRPQVSNIVGVGAALQAAGGPGPGAAPISPLDLPVVLAAAIARWEAAGVSAGQLAQLRSASLEIIDLAGGTLGQTIDHRIFVDATAAGRGWYVDPTPGDDREFDVTNVSGELLAARGTIAAGQIDLLTVLLHELGHVLGESDLPAAQTHALLSSTLGTGVRHLPAGSAPIDAFTIAGQFATNAANSLDVNGDGSVAPGDALLIINALNVGLHAWLIENAAAEPASDSFLDVDGDTFVSPADALAVINYLNNRSTMSFAVGEGELSDLPHESAPLFASQGPSSLPAAPPLAPAKPPTAAPSSRELPPDDSSGVAGVAEFFTGHSAGDTPDDPWDALLGLIAEQATAT